MIPAYVIGLHSLRFQTLKSELSDLGINAQFWEAAEANTPELGCFESHKSVWKQIVQTNVATFVFEDDIAIRVGVKEFNLTHHHAQSLDAVLYGYCQASRVRTEKITRSLYKYTQAYCAHAYWVTPYAAASLLQYQNTTRPFRLLADDATSYVFKHIKTGMVSPPFFFQDIWTYHSALRSDKMAQHNVAVFQESFICYYVRTTVLLFSVLFLTTAYVWARKGIR